MVAGRSKNVGMPIAMLLHTDGRHERPGGRTGCVRALLGDKTKACAPLTPLFSVAGDATVTISHRYTPKDQLRQHTKIADIIVAAAGLLVGSFVNLFLSFCCTSLTVLFVRVCALLTFQGFQTSSLQT